MIPEITITVIENTSIDHKSKFATALNICKSYAYNTLFNNACNSTLNPKYNIFSFDMKNSLS